MALSVRNSVSLLIVSESSFDFHEAALDEVGIVAVTLSAYEMEEVARKTWVSWAYLYL